MTTHWHWFKQLQPKPNQLKAVTVVQTIPSKSKLVTGAAPSHHQTRTVSDSVALHQMAAAVWFLGRQRKSHPNAPEIQLTSILIELWDIEFPSRRWSEGDNHFLPLQLPYTKQIAVNRKCASQEKQTTTINYWHTCQIWNFWQETSIFCPPVTCDF